MTISCSSPEQKLAPGVRFPDSEKFSALVNGKQVSLFTLTNKHGMRADITNYGGRIVSLMVPDKNGVLEDIVTGYHSIHEYLNNDEMYFGALIGRYGNRIAHARFSIEGEEYVLAANNGPNSLHGGPNGFHNVVWDAEQLDSQTLKLTYQSPDMEEGFPGNLTAEVMYTLTDQDELTISYKAVTDKATHVNLTNHAYFNLSGEGNRSISDHMMRIHADQFVPVNEDLIPLGAFADVSDTPFDFTDYRAMGELINSDHEQIRIGGGYDHSFVIRKGEDVAKPRLAAEVYHPASGIKMEILTTEPGVQFYSGNFMTGQFTGKRGEAYAYRTAFCLETQHFPDTPNQPEFSSTLLRPGEVYQSKTIHRFSVRND